MKPKKYEEVKIEHDKTLKEIKRDFKILSTFSIAMTIIALIISIACMKLGIENEALKIENEALVEVIEEMKK